MKENGKHYTMEYQKMYPYYDSKNILYLILFIFIIIFLLTLHLKLN